MSFVDSQSLRPYILLTAEGGCLWFEEVSVGDGAGCAEVREELETEADHKVPDVSGHLGASDKHPPDEDDQKGVEGVADVPQFPQMLSGSRNVGHVFIQDVLLGADAIILYVLGPVQLAHIKVKCLPVLRG